MRSIFDAARSQADRGQASWAAFALTVWLVFSLVGLAAIVIGLARLVGMLW